MRFDQGWVDEITSDLDDLLTKATACVGKKEARSFAYVGNIVDLWEKIVEKDIQVNP